eukprot:5936212-Prymnesium_polylepis.3
MCPRGAHLLLKRLGEARAHPPVALALGRTPFEPIRLLVALGGGRVDHGKGDLELHLPKAAPRALPGRIEAVVLAQMRDDARALGRIVDALGEEGDALGPWAGC